MSKTTTSLAAIGALVCLTATAQAHATLEQSHATPGETATVTLRVPHGCDGAATEAVRMEIPAGLDAVTPEPKPGWDLSTEADPDAPDAIRAVTWSGGSLPDGETGNFSLTATVPSDMAPGGRIHFPAVQTCAEGSVGWTDTSGASDVPDPAPFLTLLAGDAPAGPVTLGDLEISAAFARASLASQPVGAGYLSITNGGQSDDRLVEVRSDVADRVDLHESVAEDGVMRMRAVETGVAIPAGETVALAPGGYHVMFMGLTDPLVAGERAAVTLVFERAGSVTLDMPILARDAVAPGTGHDGMDHGGTGHGNTDHGGSDHGAGGHGGMDHGN